MRPSFPKGTAELHLVANVPIKAGDELNISFVRSTPTEGENKVDNRKNRRQELARGWRFACECDKCMKEGAEQGVSDRKESAEHGASNKESTEHEVSSTSPS